MNFPIQACAACGEQTENLYCPNCRRKLTRDEIKVFWNAQSWAQYRATVLDFQSFSTSLPYLETRVLDSQAEEAPKPRKLGLLFGIVAAALVAVAALAIWFTRVNAPETKVQDVADRPKLDQNGRPVRGIDEVHTRTPLATPGARTPRPASRAPGQPSTYDPEVDEVCGVGASQPHEVPADSTVEDLCGSAQPQGPPATPGPEDVSGYAPPPPPPHPADEAEAEEISQNASKPNP
jgi:hypothetical protein